MDDQSQNNYSMFCFLISNVMDIDLNMINHVNKPYKYKNLCVSIIIVILNDSKEEILNLICKCQGP